MNDVTTKTQIIDIKHIIEEKDGLPVKFQRLYYQNKKLKDNHTAGYYQIQAEHELHLNGRLRGGGKRAAATAFKEDKDKLSRDERIAAKKAELNVLLLQLQELGNASTKPVVSHIAQALNEGDHVIDATLLHMFIATLRKLLENLHSTTNMIR